MNRVQFRQFWPCVTALAPKLDCRVIFDVGANVGNTVLRFRPQFPTAQIYALEPDPQIFRALKARTARDPNIIPIQAAVAERDGKAQFHRNTRPGASSLFGRPNGTRYYDPSSSVESTFPVALRALDSLASEYGIGSIDILKLDIQGAEHAALQGAAGLLGRGAISVVMTEFFFIPHYDGTPLLDEIWTLMRRHGYEMFNLFPGPHAANGQAKWGDAIFVSPTFRAELEKQGT